MALRSSARKSYARRRKASHCTGKRARTCNKTRGCKHASGKKRSFCRKTKSTRRRRGGGRTRRR
tara:strand:+ start:255 stop:446 length:192 start_codon:yes stop_codon:yes gene_type:complete